MTLFLIIQVIIIPAFDPEATEYQHVIDYGEGIDKDEIQKIFNKYYSITNKTTRIGLFCSL